MNVVSVGEASIQISNCIREHTQERSPLNVLTAGKPTVTNKVLIIIVEHTQGRSPVDMINVTYHSATVCFLLNTREFQKERRTISIIYVRNLFW